MLLSLLNTKETLKFLDLAIYMVEVDEEHKNVRSDVLSRIFREVGFVSDYSFDNSESVEDTINYFADRNPVVKSVVYLNLAKLSLVDDLYNTTEHHFLVKIQEKLGISPERRKELMMLVYEERDFREKVARTVKTDYE